ncbi:sugar transferase involved in lipopolysaccharide synthesis [Oleiphilus messinensis]|uniref:Sugar transferase involved in lipopolysaccharide synthesis n=1 Tax=Oleiphilus messinensis TaxID=141451 RepID=A0A1Y0IJ58_9GAMM|nr:sugar transferase [Oleiphilus messinensis]ARU59555.1 sugar transferase involved in lipopolysaccharide synthesis [Oleiphilus messinensis]
MKRLFDTLIAAVALIVLAPFLTLLMILIWFQDWHSPLYIANRVGKDGKAFRMVKLRSMVINADKNGVDSTAADDVRITRLGRFIRQFKLDELTQLWNVLMGHISLVGPRPNVKADTDLYTLEEQGLLSIRPGITDFSSIVFSDEGDILAGRDNPDLVYNQIIRPWKSRLGLFYVKNSNLMVDSKLIGLTILAIFNKKKSLQYLAKLLADLGAEEKLIKICLREDELTPYPPPGANEVVALR